MPVWWTIDPPLGLAQMAGCLKSAGHEVSVFDLNILLWKDRPPQYRNLWLWEQFHFWNYPEQVDRYFHDNRAVIESHLERILRTDARVIGFSVNIGSHLPCLRMAELVKRADPSRTVVFGGQYFFLGDKARSVLEENACVDAIVRGAADETFPRLVSDVERSGRAVARPGIVARAAGAVVDPGPAPALRDLDRLPFSDFTLFPMELYTDPSRIPMAASRGCVWSCRFCSTREFWNGYSYMSGDRIFAEVLHQRRLFPSRPHVDFYDITANGRPEALYRFAQLAVDHHSGSTLMRIGWKINAILRPEMTPELLQGYRRGGCTEIIYGVESGSPRVLKLMNKNYNVRVAEEVLRNTHEARIITTGNFMFGFPGESEEDFRMTLAFLQRNAVSFDKAYASATFTSLEENSYLTGHQDEFGVKPPPAGKDFHSLYWESEDGTNTFPVRMDRYIRFRELAGRLGLEAYKGIDGDLEQERQSHLAQYHRYRNNRLRAAEAYVAYLRTDPSHGPMRRELVEYRDDLARLPDAQRRLREWAERHRDVPADARRAVWETGWEWLTDDKPFRLEECPSLQAWTARHPEHAAFVRDLLDLHAHLQSSGSHAFVRWTEDAGYRLFLGNDAVDGTSAERLLAEAQSALSAEPAGAAGAAR
jgi:radical SAM superfamily enzyme YgiQ (UPF0313 family)